MEEREPPPRDENHGEIHEKRAISPEETLDHNILPETCQSQPAEGIDHNILPETSQSDQPVFRSGTYVVQVPKDQIYRVPPPEHAALAQHRNQPQQKKPCCNCCLCITLFAVIIVLIGLIGGLTAFFLYKHENPLFTIEHFHVKNPPDHHQLEYNIVLTSRNPNQHTSIFYNEDGNAALSFKQKEIARGKFPPFNQSPKNSSTIEIILHYSNTALPKEIETNMNSTNSKARVSFSLSMNFRMQLKFWAFKTRNKKISVDCSLIVDVAKGTSRVESQQCLTNS